MAGGRRNWIPRGAILLVFVTFVAQAVALDQTHSQTTDHASRAFTQGMCTNIDRVLDDFEKNCLASHSHTEADHNKTPSKYSPRVCGYVTKLLAFAANLSSADMLGISSSFLAQQTTVGKSGQTAFDMSSLPGSGQRTTIPSEFQNLAKAPGATEISSEIASSFGQHYSYFQNYVSMQQLWMYWFWYQQLEVKIQNIYGKAFHGAQEVQIYQVLATIDKHIIQLLEVRRKLERHLVRLIDCSRRKIVIIDIILRLKYRYVYLYQILIKVVRYYSYIYEKREKLVKIKIEIIEALQGCCKRMHEYHTEFKRIRLLIHKWDENFDLSGGCFGTIRSEWKASYKKWVKCWEDVVHEIEGFHFEINGFDDNCNSVRQTCVRNIDLSKKEEHTSLFTKMHKEAETMDYAVSVNGFHGAFVKGH